MTATTETVPHPRVELPVLGHPRPDGQKAPARRLRCTLTRRAGRSAGRHADVSIDATRRGHRGRHRPPPASSTRSSRRTRRRPTPALCRSGRSSTGATASRCSVQIRSRSDSTNRSRHSESDAPSAHPERYEDDRQRDRAHKRPWQFPADPDGRAPTSAPRSPVIAPRARSRSCPLPRRGVRRDPPRHLEPDGVVDRLNFCPRPGRCPAPLAGRRRPPRPLPAPDRRGQEDRHRVGQPRRSRPPSTGRLDTSVPGVEGLQLTLRLTPRARPDLWPRRRIRITTVTPRSTLRHRVDSAGGPLHTFPVLVNTRPAAAYPVEIGLQGRPTLVRSSSRGTEVLAYPSWRHAYVSGTLWYRDRTTFCEPHSITSAGLYPAVAIVSRPDVLNGRLLLLGTGKDSTGQRDVNGGAAPSPA